MSDSRKSTGGDPMPRQTTFLKAGTHEPKWVVVDAANVPSADWPPGLRRFSKASTLPIGPARHER